MTESSLRHRASLDRAIRAARAALEPERSGLLTDFDGTLSEIVAEPADARLVDGAAEALATLADRLAVVAIITGRSAADARRLTGMSGVLVVGNHGVEWLEAGSERATPHPDAGPVAERLDAVLATVPTQPGVVIERKGLSATVHYRNSSEPSATRDAIVASLSDAPANEIEVREGRMSVELRPRGLGDKGRAARAIIERHSLGGVVVLGDDLTDLDMFAAVASLREVGSVRAAIIAVDGPAREAPREVVSAADAVVEGPAEVAALLAALAER